MYMVITIHTCIWLMTNLSFNYYDLQIYIVNYKLHITIEFI